MANTSVSFAEVPPKAGVSGYLDVAVNRACLAYAVADTLAYKLDENSELSASRIDVLNNQILRLAYVSDARFLADPSIEDVDRELGWVVVARQGLKRMSHLVGNQKHKSVLFSPRSEVEQKEIFYQMDQMRQLGQFGITLSESADIPTQTALHEAAEHLSNRGGYFMN